MLDLAVEYIKELQEQFKVSKQILNLNCLHLAKWFSFFIHEFMYFCRVLVKIEPTASVKYAEPKSQIKLLKLADVQKIRVMES